MAETGSEVQDANVEMVDADTAKDVAVTDEGAPTGDAAKGEAPAEQPAEGDAAAAERKMVLFTVCLACLLYTSPSPRD